MRKIVALVLVLMLCGCALAERVPGNWLGFQVLAQLSDGNHNVIVSPIGLTWSLAMAADGAAGETRARLLKALDLNEPEDAAALAESMKDTGLRWANAAFADPGLKLLPDYVERLNTVYGAPCFPLNDQSEADAWVSEQTEGLLDGLPASGSFQEAQLVLLNAVSMDAGTRHEWVGARVKDVEMKSRIVILLSDGVSNTGAVEPDAAAEAAAKLGIRVYTIGVGTRSNRTPFRARDMFGRSVIQYADMSFDESQLKSIAAKTGARYFGVRDEGGLKAALEEIDSLEKTTLDRTAYQRWHEYFPWFLVPGAALVLLAVSLQMFASRRLV